jgi:hypothetical protein
MRIASSHLSAWLVALLLALLLPSAQIAGFTGQWAGVLPGRTSVMLNVFGQRQTAQRHLLVRRHQANIQRLGYKAFFMAATPGAHRTGSPVPLLREDYTGHDHLREGRPSQSDAHRPELSSRIPQSTTRRADPAGSSFADIRAEGPRSSTWPRPDDLAPLSRISLPRRSHALPLR